MQHHDPRSPESFPEPFAHVSAPNSPSFGTTWNVQSSLPLFASKPRTSSGGLFFHFWPPSPAPSRLPAMTTTSPTTIGPELHPKLRAPSGTRFSRPPVPKPATALPRKSSEYR